MTPSDSFLPLEYGHIHSITGSYTAFASPNYANMLRFQPTIAGEYRFSVNSSMTGMSIRVIDPTLTNGLL